MLRSTSIISYAWLLVLLTADILVLAQTKTTYTMPVIPRPTRAALKESMSRQYDEGAPAHKAEIAGMARFIGSDETGADNDFLVLVNEFKGRVIVRQSVCYDCPEYRERTVVGYRAPCYDMSDYDVISGNVETLTDKEYYILRERMENMLKNGEDLRLTMLAYMSFVRKGVPRSLVFGGHGWGSEDIEIGPSPWQGPIARPYEKKLFRWNPPYEVSRAIRPYVWNEPVQLIVENISID